MVTAVVGGGISGQTDSGGGRRRWAARALFLGWQQHGRSRRGKGVSCLPVLLVDRCWVGGSRAALAGRATGERVQRRGGRAW